jgi:DNA-binding Xre family transcriptional regulator
MEKETTAIGPDVMVALPKCEMVEHAQEQLVLAIHRSDKSKKEIAGLVGMSTRNLRRLLKGTSMRMETADKIAAVLGLEWSGVDGMKLVPRTY